MAVESLETPAFSELGRLDVDDKRTGMKPQQIRTVLIGKSQLNCEKS